MNSVIAKLQESDMLWIVAFTGVCALVAMGKLKPETVEYLLFAVVGRSGIKPNKGKGNDDAQRTTGAN